MSPYAEQSNRLAIRAIRSHHAGLHQAALNRVFDTWTTVTHVPARISAPLADPLRVHYPQAADRAASEEAGHASERVQCIDAADFTLARDGVHSPSNWVWNLYDESFARACAPVSRDPVAAATGQTAHQQDLASWAYFVRVGSQHFVLEDRRPRLPHDVLVLAALTSPSFDSSRALVDRARQDNPWP